MEIYILKSSACLAIFLLVYKLSLENESMHVFKRYYLLTAVFMSLSIPLVTFTTYVDPVVFEVSNLPAYDTLESPKEAIQEPVNFWPTILWSIYTVGVLLFGLKFVLNLSKIMLKIKNNQKLQSPPFIHVLLNNLVAPHTFFNFIFLNKQSLESNQIPQEVFWHEETHAKQKHSIDILLIELLQVILWFNPLIYLAKRSIKLNHEFLADEAVLTKGINPSTYQQLLLAFSSNASEPQLANAINYSSIKKRFTVMTTNTSKQKIWLRSFLLLPLVALTLYGFSEKEIIEKETPREILQKQSNYKQFNVEDSNEYGIYGHNDQQRATPEEIAEYNKLAKHYNNLDDDHQVIKLKDMKRISEIYEKMSKEQRANAEPLPNFPPPPPPPSAIATNTPPPPVPSSGNYTYKHTTKDGRIVDVLVMTDEDQLTPPPPPPPEILSSSMVKTGFIKVKGEQIYYVENARKRTYYNRKGIMVDENGEKVNGDLQVNASDVIPGQYISKVYKNDKVVVEFKDNLPGLKIAPPPPPPAPIAPLDHVIDMAKKGAIFYYEGKLIPSDEAINQLKNNKELNISSKESNSKHPKIYITKDPITNED